MRGERLLNLMQLAGIVLQALLSAVQALAGLLPILVQRLQTQRRLTGGQLRQLRLGHAHIILHLLHGLLAGVYLSLSIAQFFAPTALAL